MNFFSIIVAKFFKNLATIIGLTFLFPKIEVALPFCLVEFLKFLDRKKDFGADGYIIIHIYFIIKSKSITLIVDC